ncbi:MAG: hypothetical protein H0U60_08760 [Blastocatellia bacterium]|nr:hypothetical protein [Blastocatellia bacterium]
MKQHSSRIKRSLIRLVHKDRAYALFYDGTTVGLGDLPGNYATTHHRKVDVVYTLAF